MTNAHHTLARERPGRSVLPALLAVILVGCGGGSGGGDSGGGGLPGAGAPPPTGTPPGGGSPPGGGTDPVDLGIDRSGVIYLSISSFGSIVAGGIRYAVADAEITLNGRSATQTDLSSGDVALIVGDINEDGATGSAQRVVVEDLLRGTIDTIDPDTGEFRMLSQIVRTVPDTIFGAGISPRDITGLATGVPVVVRGFVAADGRIVASRIEPPEVEGLRVTGFVSSVEPAVFQMVVNGLTVDYASADLEDFPGSGPVPGDFIVADAVDIGQGTFRATRIASLSGRSREGCERVEGACAGELEGYVSRFGSAADFDVDGFRVSVDAETSFSGGDVDDLGVDAKLRVSGEVDDDGTLHATTVIFDDDDRPIAIEAPVQSIDEDTSLVQLLGIPVRIDARTRYEDFVEPNPSLADLRVGDYLKIAGRELVADAGRVLATRVERDDPDEDVELRGFVEAIADPELTVLGVTIRTNSETEFEIDDEELSQSEFFARLRIGELVEIKGVQIGESIVLAEELETDEP
jgi:hypothetical protein